MSPGLTLIPSVTLQIMEGGKLRSVTSQEVFSGKNVALFGVPGAFTPACHHIHLPEIAAEYKRYEASGIDLVALTAVNDIYVLEAWRRSLGIADDILFLADGNGDFAKSLGLIFDGRKLGLGIRSKRYAMWVRNGDIQHLSVDPDPTQVDVSSAYSLLLVFESWSESA
jgi:glutaredoxin/glutathione-dependent peroxiredoxin